MSITIDDIGKFVLCNGNLARIIAFMPESVVVEAIAERCPTCGTKPRNHYVEGSRAWLSDIYPVPTIEPPIPNMGQVP